MDNTNTVNYNRVYTRIGHDPNQLDLAVIYKETNRGVIIGKLKTEVIIIDIDLVNAYQGDTVTVLNYKRFPNTDEAYLKMMRWIGKMIKKSVFSRYFNKYDPYDHVTKENKADVENLISKIKEAVDEMDIPKYV
jgi:hypothetical protein